MTAVSSRIFISYRRDDSGGHAGRLYDRLVNRFGSQVFRDIDGLDLGVPWKQAIEESVGSADVFIAVIGPDWAGVDKSGRRRLDDPQDWVRREVGAALRRDIRVIPVLVGGASIPTELPEDLAPLADLQDLRITESDWNAGVERLFATIDRVLGTQPSPPPAPVPAPVPGISAAVLPLAIVGAGLLAVGLFMPWDQGHTFLQNNFGGALPHGGVFTALAPVGIVVAVVLGAVLARNEGTRAIGVGVLFGAGLAGVVKYLRVMQAGHDQSAGTRIGVLLAIAGGILVLAAAYLALQATLDRESERNPTAAVFGIAGAVVMIAATSVNFNGGGTNPDRDAAKLARSFGEAFDPVMTALLIALIAALLFGRSRHAELSAALVTLGALDALLWFRYLVVPVLEDAWAGSFGWGGVVGLAGALLVIGGGLLGLKGSSEVVPVAAPAGT